MSSSPDSLFKRLLRMQVLLMLALLLVFSLLFYVERNRSIAVLQAEQWAPMLQRELALDSREPPSLVLQRAQALPGNAVRPNFESPRVRALRSTLQARGVPLADIAFSPGERGTLVWLQLQPAGGPPVWFALSGRLIEQAWPLRLLIGLLVAAAALAWASWVFTRRLTQPLQALRAQLQATSPHDLASTAGAAAGVQVLADAPPEIGEIAAAHTALMQRLAQHERERALLLAGVSHDLRSPLARIRMAAELLPEHADNTRAREAIVRNTQIADRMVESFLDHVRAGEAPLDQEVDIAVLARKVAAGFARPADELQVEAPASLRLPRANAELLERVLANLVDNAFKHGGAPVRLRLAQRGPAGSGPHEAVIEVEDAGPGIAPAEREAALVAFARGDASRATPGTGLGLAVVQRVVARLGGRVEIEGPAGDAAAPRPACVRLRLPLP